MERFATNSVTPLVFCGQPHCALLIYIMLTLNLDFDMKIKGKKQTGGVTAHDFVGRRCVQKLSVLFWTVIRKQVSHIVEDTMDKSTTSRTTKNFAYVG